MREATVTRLNKATGCQWAEVAPGHFMCAHQLVLRSVYAEAAEPSALQQAHALTARQGQPSKEEAGESRGLPHS